MSHNQKKRSHQHDCLSTPVFPSASSLPRSCPRPQERRAAELLALFDLPLSEELWHFLVHNSGSLPLDSVVHLLDAQQASPQRIERLFALLELVQRTMMNKASQPRIACPADILPHIPDLLLLDHEELWVLLLNKQHEVQARLPLYKGTVDSSVLRVAEIYRPALVSNCPSLIVCHNHPSGDPEPSPADIEVTQQLREAGNLLEVELLDHLIVGSAFPFRIISLREQLRW
jgi:DNA repair protein RadC